MSITTLPVPPSRSDPTNFAVRADEFLGALPVFGDEANALALDVNAKQSTASTAATTATTQANIALTKAGEASGSAASALTSRNEAYSLVELYLGASSTDPAVGRLGAGLIAGNWYINTITGFLKAYTGTVWVNGISAIAGVTSLNGATGDITEVTTSTNSQTLTNKTINLSLNTVTVDGTNTVGYINIPIASKSNDYILEITDQGKAIFHPGTDTVPRTFTIPSNATVSFPIGTAITFVNQNAAGVITIAISTDTMRLVGEGITGSRTLKANGICTAVKLQSTEWIISGTGLT